MTIRSIDQRKGDLLMEQKEVKELKVLPFIKLSDLTKDDVVRGRKEGTFVVLPTLFKRGYSKNGTETVSITVKVFDPYLSQVRLKNGNDFLSASTFHRFLLATDTNYKDKRGYDKNLFNKDALCRFVKGTYSNRDEEYYSLEVIFTQGEYIVHFFSYDDVQIIKNLEEKGIHKFNWQVRPDKIDFTEPSEAFNF